jgi:hypothetical protein
MLYVPDSKWFGYTFGDKSLFRGLSGEEAVPDFNRKLNGRTLNVFR